MIGGDRDKRLRNGWKLRCTRGVEIGTATFQIVFVTNGRELEWRTGRTLEEQSPAETFLVVGRAATRVKPPSSRRVSESGSR